MVRAFHLSRPVTGGGGAATRLTTGKSGWRKSRKQHGDGGEQGAQMLTENSVEYVDLRFTDPRGKWQHTAQHVSTVDEDVFSDGFMFDGSSIAGWKAINECDMILMPDPATAVMDPFAAKPSLVLICDIMEPSTGQFYARDPRAPPSCARLTSIKRRRRRHLHWRGSRILHLRQREVRHRRQLCHLSGR